MGLWYDEGTQCLWHVNYSVEPLSQPSLWIIRWLWKDFFHPPQTDTAWKCDCTNAVQFLTLSGLIKMPVLQAQNQKVDWFEIHVFSNSILWLKYFYFFLDYNNEDEFGRKLRFLLQQLPPVNYSLLKFLCKFLANVASHHEEIWSASSLAAVFGPDVFQ